jgi:hypothetical protein
VGNRILGVLFLGLAVAGVVFLGDRVSPRRGLVVTAGPGEKAAGNATATTGATGTETAAAPGPETAPALAPGPSTTTTAPGATSPTVAAPALTDQVLAQQMVLRAEDLPAGFAQHPAGTGRAGASGSGADAFDSCLGSDTAALRRALKVRAYSPGFTRRPSSVVSSAVALFDTPASAARVLAAIRSESARVCLEKRANDNLADDPGFPEGSSGTMTRIVLGQFGEEARGYRLEVRMPPPEAGGKETTYLADYLFVRKGRAVVLVQFGSLDRPFPVAEAQSVVGRLAGRM